MKFLKHTILSLLMVIGLLLPSLASATAPSLCTITGQVLNPGGSAFANGTIIFQSPSTQTLPPSGPVIPPTSVTANTDANGNLIGTVQLIQGLVVEIAACQNGSCGASFPAIVPLLSSTSFASLGTGVLTSLSGFNAMGNKITNVGCPSTANDALAWGCNANVATLTVTGSQTVAGNLAVTGTLGASGATTLAGVTATSVTDSALANGSCVQAGVGGVLTGTGFPCAGSTGTILVGGTWDAQLNAAATVNSGSPNFTLTAGTCVPTENISVQSSSSLTATSVYGGTPQHLSVSATINSCTDSTHGVASTNFTNSVVASPTRIGADVSGAINAACQGTNCVLPAGAFGYLAGPVTLNTSGTILDGHMAYLMTGWLGNANQVLGTNGSTVINGQNAIQIGYNGCPGACTRSHANRITNVEVKNLTVDVGGLLNLNGTQLSCGVLMDYSQHVTIQNVTTVASTTYGIGAIEDWDDIKWIGDTTIAAWGDGQHFDGTFNPGDTTTNGWDIGGNVESYWDTGVTCSGGNSNSITTGVHFIGVTTNGNLAAWPGSPNAGVEGVQVDGNCQYVEITGARAITPQRYGLLLNDFNGFAPKHIKVTGGYFDSGTSSGQESVQIISGTTGINGAIQDVTLDGITAKGIAGFITISNFLAGNAQCQSCAVMITDNVQDVHFFNPTIIVTGDAGSSPANTSFEAFVDNNGGAFSTGSNRTNITFDNPIMDLTFATAPNTWSSNFSGFFMQADVSTFPSDTWFVSHPQILGTTGQIQLSNKTPGGPVPSQLTGQCAGQIALSTGTQTVTSACFRSSSDVVVCTDQTAANAIKCVASANTLTLTGTGSDVINWSLVLPLK